MDEKIRDIERRIDDTLNELRLMIDNLMRMQGELDALKKEVADDEWPKIGAERLKRDWFGVEA